MSIVTKPNIINNGATLATEATQITKEKMVTEPTLIASECIASDDGIVTSAQCTLWVSDEIDYFKGHFDDFPLLPGVVQIKWAIDFAHQLLQIPNLFQGMNVIKFQEPIYPNSEVRLHLDWNPEKSQLTFRYTSDKVIDGEQQTSTHASGKVTLGNDSE